MSQDNRTHALRRMTVAVDSTVLITLLGTETPHKISHEKNLLENLLNSVASIKGVLFTKCNETKLK